MGDGIINEKLNNSDSNLGVLPYEILIHDLTQAKRQLLELHSLVRFFNTFDFFSETQLIK